MWLAVILLCCAVIIIGAVYVPAQKPVGYGLIVIGIVALIVAATGWGPGGPHYRGQLKAPHCAVVA